MSKESRPAMPFYGKDWYTDPNVQEMSYADQGMYLRLCWHCWADGGVPDQPERLMRILQVDKATFEKSFPKLRPCFEAVDGKLIHRKIERIRAELDSFRAKKSRAGKAGAEKRWRE